MILNLYLFIYFYTAFIYYVYFLSFTSMQSNGPFLHFTTCKMYVTNKTLELELELEMEALQRCQTQSSGKELSKMWARLDHIRKFRLLKMILLMPNKISSTIMYARHYINHLYILLYTI